MKKIDYMYSDFSLTTYCERQKLDANVYILTRENYSRSKTDEKIW